MSAINRLKESSDKQKVIAWLDHISEFDETIRKEVIDLCSKDLEARRYFVKRYKEDCK